MEKIDCIFCNHANTQQVIYENDYFGKQCDDCNLIYISPRPSIDEVIDIYGHDQAQVSAQTHIKGSYLKRLYARHTLKRLGFNTLKKEFQCFLSLKKNIKT